MCGGVPRLQGPLTRETIVAEATPPGEGGIAIIRLSGPLAPAILSQIFRGNQPVEQWAGHRLYAGWLVDELGQPLDEAMAVWMRAPRSYTREHVVELQVHGSPLVVREAIHLCCAGGARPARPGEFTLRAFLNGRLSLAQAESVAQVIASESRAALQGHVSDLGGRFSRLVEQLRLDLLDWLSRLEAELDFGDEVAAEPQEANEARLLGLRQRVSRLLEGGEEGRIARRGVQVALVGPPNAGKSTLLNALLGTRRALVSPHPGTTRDRLEETLRAAGRTFRLVDTAGIRETEDPIESMGVALTRATAEESHLRLLVLDGSCSLPPLDPKVWNPDLVVLNKCDLEAALPVEEVVSWACAPALSVSAREGENLEKLLELLSERAGRVGQGSELEYFLTERQRAALHVVSSHLEELDATLRSGLSAEFLCLDLRAASQALGEILGLEISEEILERIFSTFCLGK
ncbi:tRNA uridine-5-carboxymethylaminomethyl(34) synthesis GTPase MnmE [bacterium CPR1]|nr:tRNA uridine-5-carboxymethylaminomethyl(34) synthesis GTPase MnmE [bacterium CPR1]